MATKRNDKKIKPVDEWGVEEWESAYNVLTAKYDALRRHMRVALQHLNKSV